MSDTDDGGLLSGVEVPQILGPRVPNNYDVDGRECPRCGGALEAVHRPTAESVDLECEDDDCDYREHDDENDYPRVNGILSHLHAGINLAAWPYTQLLARLVFVLALVVYTYGFYSSFNEWYAFLLIPVYWVINGAVPPEPYCPECNMAIRPHSGGDDGFCDNCGAYYEEPKTVVDTDKDPFYAGWGDSLGSLTPAWFTIDGLSLDLRTEDANALVDPLIGRYRRVWLRLFDVGTVVFATIYLVLVGAFIWFTVAVVLEPAAWGPITTPSSVPESNAVPPSVTVAQVIDGIVIVARVWGPLLVAAVASTAIHELGHGIALRLHGHNVDAFGAKFALGLVPTIGYTEPDIDLKGARSLRAAHHLDVGGITLNLISVLPFVPFIVAWGGWNPMSLLGTGLIESTVAWFFAFSLVATLNAFPIGGMDGDLFQGDSIEWLAERTGAPVAPENATTYGKLAIRALMVALFVGAVV